MVQKYREKIDKIFSDVPKEHRFWLIKGGEIKSLEDLEIALREAPDEVFRHHVNDSRNDFAEWVRNSIGDKELAETLDKIKTKESTIKAVELRISSLRNLQSIHEAIDQIKDKIDGKNEEPQNDEPPELEDLPPPQTSENEEIQKEEVPKEIKTPEIMDVPPEIKKKKNFFKDPGLYIGLLIGFLIGILLGYFL